MVANCNVGSARSATLASRHPSTDLAQEALQDGGDQATLDCVRLKHDEGQLGRHRVLLTACMAVAAHKVTTNASMGVVSHRIFLNRTPLPTFLRSALLLHADTLPVIPAAPNGMQQAAAAAAYKACTHSPSLIDIGASYPSNRLQLPLDWLIKLFSLRMLSPQQTCLFLTPRNSPTSEEVRTVSAKRVVERGARSEQGCLATQQVAQHAHA